MRRAIPALALLLCSCTMQPRIPPGAGLEYGLARLGSVRKLGQEGEGRGTVVLISDLHPLHGSITRSRDGLAHVRRDNRDAVAFLLEHGFRILGCEAAEGALPRNAVAKAHRDAYHQAVLERDDVNAWTLYQPIRLEEEFQGRLLVVGVEDPLLYERDVQRLLALRSGTDEAERKTAMRGILASAAIRGRRAGQNLARLLEEREESRGALLIGRAHVESAAEELAGLGYLVAVFEASSVGAWLEAARQEGTGSP